MNPRTYNPLYAYDDPTDLATRIANVVVKSPPHLLTEGNSTYYVYPVGRPNRIKRRALRAAVMARHCDGRRGRRARYWMKVFVRLGGCVVRESECGSGDALRKRLSDLGDHMSFARGSDAVASMKATADAWSTKPI